MLTDPRRAAAACGERSRMDQPGKSLAVDGPAKRRFDAFDFPRSLTETSGDPFYCVFRSHDSTIE